MRRGEEGELGLSLLPTLPVLLPPEKLFSEGEGLFPEQKPSKQRGKLGRGDAPKSNPDSCVVLEVIWLGVRRLRSTF